MNVNCAEDSFRAPRDSIGQCAYSGNLRTIYQMSLHATYKKYVNTIQMSYCVKWNAETLEKSGPIYLNLADAGLNPENKA